VVQVRTTRVGDVNATGFTGIAVKEGNTEVVQVNLRSGGIHIMFINNFHLHNPIFCSIL
jgi:hypothetical protein